MVYRRHYQFRAGDAGWLYTLTVTDAAGCEGSSAIFWSSPMCSPPGGFHYRVLQEICEGSTAILDAGAHKKLPTFGRMVYTQVDYCPPQKEVYTMSSFPTALAAGIQHRRSLMVLYPARGQYLEESATLCEGGTVAFTATQLHLLLLGRWLFGAGSGGRCSGHVRPDRSDGTCSGSIPLKWYSSRRRNPWSWAVQRFAG